MISNRVAYSYTETKQINKSIFLKTEHERQTCAIPLTKRICFYSDQHKSVKHAELQRTRMKMMNIEVNSHSYAYDVTVVITLVCCRNEIPPPHKTDDLSMHNLKSP